MVVVPEMERIKIEMYRGRVHQKMEPIVMYIEQNHVVFYDYWLILMILIAYFIP